MTDSERLAAIEAKMVLVCTVGDGAIYSQQQMAEAVVPYGDVRWLIAEVRRLQGEYARGREDERKDVARMFRLGNFDLYGDLASLIERGEHVEATNGNDL